MKKLIYILPLIFFACKKKDCYVCTRHYSYKDTLTQKIVHGREAPDTVICDISKEQLSKLGMSKYRYRDNDTFKKNNTTDSSYWFEIYNWECNPK